MAGIANYHNDKGLAMRRLDFWVLMLCFVMPLQASDEQWYRVESPNFVFYTDHDPDEAQEQIREMELFRELALMVTGVPVTEGGPRMQVYLASSMPQFQELASTDSIQYVSVFLTRWGGDRAVVVRDFGDEEFKASTLLGTYVTELMLGNSNALYPLWYIRGLSEYLSQVKVKKGVLSYGLAAQERLDQLRMQNMDPRWAWEPYPVLMNRKSRPDSWIGTFDAQSWMAAHFFLSDEKRKPVLLAYLDEYNRHGDASAAYKNTIGKRYTNLDQELIRYFAKGRYATNTIKIAGDLKYPVEVTGLDAADAWLVKGQAYLLGDNTERCVEAFNQRLQLKPGNAESLAGLAWCKANKEDVPDLASIQLPDDASEQARLWLASAWLAQGERLRKAGKDYTATVDAAYEQAAAVLKTNKRSAKAIAIAAWAMEARGNFDMAAKLYATAAVYVPYEMVMRFGEARVLAEQGKLDEARNVFDRLMVYYEDDELGEEAKALKAKLYPDPLPE